MTVSDVAFSPLQCPAHPSCAQLESLSQQQIPVKERSQAYFPSGLSHLIVTLRLFEASIPSYAPMTEM